jgi:multisubunit Na+/H+ antiporter MnhB subunit
MTDEIDIADRIAMYVGGGLILLAIPVMGLVNTLAGSMAPLYAYEAGEKTGLVYAPAAAPEGAEIVTSPLFDPHLRAGLVALGLLTWAGLGVYKLVAGEPGSTTTRTTTAGTAD